MTAGAGLTAGIEPEDAGIDPAGGGISARSLFIRVLLNNGIFVAFVVLFVLLSVSSDAFLTFDNLRNLVEGNSEIGIVACAVTLVVVAGGLDLSVGAIFAFAGVIAAEVAIATDPAIGFLAGAAAGLVLGAVNGIMVTIGRVNSFIATLAVGLVVRSLAMVITGGFRVVPDAGSGFDSLGRGDIIGIPVIIWVFAATALLSGAILARGRFGREVSMVGIKPMAARLSGVAVERVRFLTFVGSGLAAAVAGVIITSRGGQAGAEAATGFELPVLAAVAIGGTSFAGGEGSVLRTVVGVLFIGLVDNGLNLLAVDSEYQQLVLGVMVLIAISVDLLRRRNSEYTPAS
jgi:ribose transport system permease protein